MRRFRPRQSMLALLVPLALGACADSPGVVSTVVPDQRHLGSVVAGEPNAALAARDMLKAGGSAADAAAALAMTLAVTMPSRASLWAGGVCLVHHSEDGVQDVYAFTHPPGRDGEAPPPPLVRGLGLMHASHGRLRWSAVPAAAERLARLGHPVSRAFAQDLASAPDGLAAAFAGQTGGRLREGVSLAQPQLAEVLGRIRLSGPGAPYSGPLAEALKRGAAAAGYRLDGAALQAALPSRQDALSAEGGSWQAYFAGEAASAGPQQAAAWPRLAGDDRTTDAKEGALALSIAAAGEAAGGPEAGGGTGFAVVDADGLAVACGLSMNAPFGTGRLAAGTGILIAASRPEGSVDPALSPFIVTGGSRDEVRFAGVASGMGAERIGIAVALRALAEADTLQSAIGRPRAVRGSGQQLFVEAAVPQAARAGLRTDGDALTEVGALGFVAAIHCPAGHVDDPGAVCDAQSDPRGAGLAVQVSGD